mgnify:CR=1 FL=1
MTKYAKYSKGEPPNRRKSPMAGLTAKERKRKAQQSKNSRTVDKGKPSSARNLGTRVVGITSDGKKVYNYRGR